MITSLRQYLLSVVSAAVICVIIKVIIGQKSGAAAIVKVLTGIFLTVTVIAPLPKLELSNIPEYFNSLPADAESAASIGTSYRRNELTRIIKLQTETYILDKAASLGIEVKVDVSVDNSDPPIPNAVTISTSTAAPYARERLKQYIERELGIPEAKQIWV